MKVKVKKLKFRKPKRQANGQFKKGFSGNPKGRQATGKDELWQAIHCVEVRLKRPWLESIIERSYSEPSLALGLLSRLYPSLKAVEHSGRLESTMSTEEVEEIRKQLKAQFEHNSQAIDAAKIIEENNE